MPDFIQQTELRHASPDRTILPPVESENPHPETAAARNQSSQRFAQTCPLRMPAPGSCPFGGICHSCPARVQAKLTVSQPGDEYEQEADRVAEQVMTMPEPQVQRACPSCEDETLQTKPLADQITPLVQRQEEEYDKEEPIQTKRSGGQSSRSSFGLADQVHSVRDVGQPLPQSTRNFFESRFKHDFSQVRVHTDGQAVEATRALHARAFTIGRDIVFSTGQYTPETNSGKKLLAHELTHVVQQRGGYAPQTLQREQGGLGSTPGTAGGGNTPAPAPPARDRPCRVLGSSLVMAAGGPVVDGWGRYGYYLRAGTQTTPGMGFWGLLETNVQGCGRALFVQNVQTFRQVEFVDGSELVLSSDQWHADGIGPYPSMRAPRPVRPENNPRQLFRYTNDTPEMNTGTIEGERFTEGCIRSMQVRDTFRMYFQFWPQGRARRSLQLGEWSWTAAARKATERDRLAVDTSRSQILPAEGLGRATSDQPLVSPNVENLQYIVVPHSTSEFTWAHLFQGALNQNQRRRH